MIARLRDVERRNLGPGGAAFVAATLVALLGLRAVAEEAPVERPAPRGAVELRLLGVIDFHGHLEPPRPGIGGAAWLGAHLDRATIPGRTIRVHAGDMVGASPLISSHFHDEPSVEVANRLRFDVGTLGNHEFDEGGDELLRLLRGGSRPGSTPGFDGIRFPVIAANTVERDGTLLLPPYRVVERAGARLGFIGVTTENTPHFLLPRHASRFRFTDISDAVDRWVPELRRRGVEAIVVLAHSGGKDGAGEIVDEAAEMSDAVDVVIAGHSHSELNLRVPNRSGRGDKLVVEALSYGTAYDRVDMTVDRASGEVTAKTAAVPRTHHAGVAPDAPLAALVERYRRLVEPLASRPAGHAERPTTRAGGALGRLAAEAQRAFADADVAFVNAASLRADLPAGARTYADLFEAQAYDHRLLRMELTGEQIAGLVRARWDRGGLYAAGLTVTGAGALLLPGGDALRPDAAYTVVANELLATGPTFPLPRTAARPVGTEVEALAAHLAPAR